MSKVIFSNCKQIITIHSCVVYRVGAEALPVPFLCGSRCESGFIDFSDYWITRTHYISIMSLENFIKARTVSWLRKWLQIC